MAEKHQRRPRVLRGIPVLLILAAIGFFGWRAATRREDYTGGDVHTTGTIEAVHVQLAFQVGGRLAAVPVSEGAVVRPGQLVGRLDPEEFEVRAQSAAAMLEAAEAARLQAQAARAQAKANRDRAAQDWKRTASLVKEEAITPQQVDAARAAAEATEAQLQAAAAQEQDAEAQVHQAQSALAQARLQVSYTQLYAPEAGQVAEVIRRPGEMVLAGTPVISVAQVDTVELHAAVDETRIGAVRPGDRVRAKVYTFNGQVFEGVVTDIVPAGDFATRKDWGAQRRDIRTFSVTASMPNPEYLLKDGMTAEVAIAVNPAVQKLVGAGR
jgi:HlyD family secretion protein